VDKNVSALFLGDEAIAFAVVEPFDSTFHSFFLLVASCSAGYYTPYGITKYSRIKKLSQEAFEVPNMLIQNDIIIPQNRKGRA